MKKIFGAAVLAAALTVGTASAATVVTTPVQYFVSQQQTDIDETIQVAQFDPSSYGYALNSVHIWLEASAFSGPGEVTCVAPGLGGLCEGTVESEIVVTLSAPGPIQLTQVIPLTTFNFSIAGALNTQAIPVDSDTQNSGWVVYELPADAALIALFSGNGTVGINLIGDGTTTTVNTNGAAAAVNALEGSANFLVAYDYIIPDPVPEPGTFVLMGTALLGAAVAIRRRRKVNG